MNGEIFFNHQLVDFNLDKKSIVFSNNLSYKVSHIAACDGIRSICREKFIDQTQPSYSGYSVWRAILDKEQTEISELTFYCTSHPNMQSSFNVENWDPYIFTTRSELDTAVDLWISDESTALNTYGHISNWDVSQVTDFSELFKYASSFNDDISVWDVSSGNDFGEMFSDATSFNQDLSSWNVGSGRNFYAMFNYAVSTPMFNYTV